METVSIKKEPIDIKEEPLEAIENPLLDHRFDETLLVPKIEVIETATDVDILSNSTTVQAENTPSLSCPKCHIRYYSAMSIKNHIQVCKKDIHQLGGSSSVPMERHGKAKPKIVIKGVKKLSDDEKRSIRILEQSCFVNELNKDEGNQ